MQLDHVMILVSFFFSLSFGLCLLAGPGNRQSPNSNKFRATCFPVFGLLAFLFFFVKSKIVFRSCIFRCFVVQNIISLFFFHFICCGGIHHQDFCREVLVIAQSVCRRRSLFRRDPQPAVERASPFYLSPLRRHAGRAPSTTDGPHGEWRIESFRVLPDTRTRGGLCLSWCGICHAKRGTPGLVHNGNSAAQGLP